VSEIVEKQPLLTYFDIRISASRRMDVHKEALLRIRNIYLSCLAVLGLLTRNTALIRRDDVYISFGLIFCRSTSLLRQDCDLLETLSWEIGEYAPG
jgi:hypothetical protein